METNIDNGIKLQFNTHLMTTQHCVICYTPYRSANNKCTREDYINKGESVTLQKQITAFLPRFIRQE